MPLPESLNITIPAQTNSVVWKGPCSDGPNGGVTYSMLNAWLSCRERFRVKYVLGLKAEDRFNHRIEYGNMFHVCDESYATGQGYWREDLIAYTEKLLMKYPLNHDEISKWYNVCLKQFPLYVEYWQGHADEVNRTPLMQEYVFKVPYKLPSGNTVILRGKFDAVDLIGDEVWLKETKTKGDIDEIKMRRQLSMDLQTMLYLVALEKLRESGQIGNPIRGVRYNVCRRPLSGGKGTIVRHKATKNKPEESYEDYYERVAQYIRDEPESYFMRWNTEIDRHAIHNFQVRCLNPILEQLVEWYECMRFSKKDAFDVGFNCSDNHGIHYQTPFGITNPLQDGGSSEYDGYLEFGSTVGLRKVDKLFDELN